MGNYNLGILRRGFECFQAPLASLPLKSLWSFPSKVCCSSQLYCANHKTKNQSFSILSKFEHFHRQIQGLKLKECGKHIIVAKHQTGGKRNEWEGNWPYEDLSCAVLEDGIEGLEGNKSSDETRERGVSCPFWSHQFSLFETADWCVRRRHTNH